MIELTYAVLETDFPMVIAGWGVLLISLLITAFWMLYLYR